MFIERQDVFKEEKVEGQNSDFCNFLFPQQFAFWLFFQPHLKCNYGDLLNFPHPTFFTAWVFLGSVVRNCKILVPLSALFRKISPPFQHFATSNSGNILIFKSSVLSILAAFCLKVAEKFSWLSWNFLPRTFSLTYFIFLSWITGTNLQWHKTKNICSEKMMGLISLYILLEQFIVILNILHLFSMQWIFPNIFFIHSQLFGRCERSNYVLTDSTILNKFFAPCELLYLRKIGCHFQTFNC